MFLRMTYFLIVKKIPDGYMSLVFLDYGTDIE